MRTRTVIVFVLVLFLIFLGLFLFVSQNGGVYATLNSLKLIPQPEPFTELYFENASGLPHSVGTMKQISFSFIIHNVEYTTTTYPYVAYLEYPSGQRVDLASGIVTLPSDASTTISVSHTFASSSFVGKVVVDLPSLDNQEIDFLLPDTNQL